MKMTRKKVKVKTQNKLKNKKLEGFDSTQSVQTEVSSLGPQFYPKMSWVGNWFSDKNQNPNRFRVLNIPFVPSSPKFNFCHLSPGDIVTNLIQSSFKVRLNKDGSGQQLSIDNVFISVILFTTFEYVLEQNIISYYMKHIIIA